MKKMQVWVPGEECDGGLIVTDVVSGDELFVSQGEVTDFDYPIGGGRFKSKKAVRGTLVSSGEKWVTVKLPDGRAVRIRIVAGWQVGTGNGKRPLVEEADEPITAGAGE